MSNCQGYNCHRKRKKKQTIQTKIWQQSPRQLLCAEFGWASAFQPQTFWWSTFFCLSRTCTVHWYMISNSIWLALLHYYNQFTVLWIEFRSRHLPGFSFWQPFHSSTWTPLCKFTWHESNTGVRGFGLAGSPSWSVGGGLVSELVVGWQPEPPGCPCEGQHCAGSLGKGKMGNRHNHRWRGRRLKGGKLKERELGQTCSSFSTSQLSVTMMYGWWNSGR